MEITNGYIVFLNVWIFNKLDQRTPRDWYFQSTSYVVICFGSRVDDEIVRMMYLSIFVFMLWHIDQFIFDRRSWNLGNLGDNFLKSTVFFHMFIQWVLRNQFIYECLQKIMHWFKYGVIFEIRPICQKSYGPIFEHLLSLAKYTFRKLWQEKYCYDYKNCNM